MNKKWIFLTGLILAWVGFISVTTDYSQAASPNSSLDTIRNLRRQIITINLIKGLYLSPEQAKQLLRLAQKAAEIKESHKNQLASRQDKLVQLLEKMKQELMSTGDISNATRKQYNDFKKQLEAPQIESLEKMHDLTKQAKSILTANQVELISKFKPCLVPPQDSRKPRTGQAGGDHLEKLLERVRSIPDDVYQARQQQFMARLRKKLILHYGVEEADKKLNEIKNIVQKARSLSDQDFALQKSQLAAQIKPQLPSRHGKKLDMIIARLLLSKDAIPALEQIASASNR